MIDEKAKDILYHIRNIQRFKSILNHINEDLDSIQKEIIRIQEPSCPNGGNGIKIENHTDKYTRINELISDEIELIQEKNDYQSRLDKAEVYLKAIKFVCDDKELEFLNEYLDGTYYKALSMKYGYENPYKKVISLIKKS